MKKMKTPPNKQSLLKKTGGSHDPSASPFPRSLYKNKFDQMVKGGMSARDAAKSIKKIMQDDMTRELAEFNS